MYRSIWIFFFNFWLLWARDAEPEPEPESEPPEPTHFGRSRSRSRSRRNGLLGAGAGAGAEKNGAAPAPKRDTIMEKYRNVNSELTNSRINRLPIVFINILRTSAIYYLKFSSLPETCIFMIWTSRKSCIRLGHDTDQKRHLGLIRLRIFKMRWVSVANDDLGLKPPISDSATRRSLWPLECQPVALDDDKWQISKTLIQSS